MDVNDILLLVDRYGFAVQYRNLIETEQARSLIVVAIKQLSNNGYTGSQDGNEDQNSKAVVRGVKVG